MAVTQDFPAKKGVGVWFGLHFGLWKDHGTTPLWLLFSSSDFGRSIEVQKIIEPWSEKYGVLTVQEKGEFAVAIEVTTGEDRDHVVRKIVEQLKEIADILSTLDCDPTGKENF